MYRGTGQPQLVSEELTTTITLPRPLKGERKEIFKDEKKTYTNIQGKRLPQNSKFRFEGEYKFGVVTSQEIDEIVRVYNKQSICKWVPHSDFPYISFMVVLSEVNPTPFQGSINRDSLELKVEGVEYIYKIPTIDNMLGGMLITRVGVIHQENVGG